MSEDNTSVGEKPGAGARFLAGVALRPIALPAGTPFRAIGLALGHGTPLLEVLVSSSVAAPNATMLRSAWKARNAARAAPLLFVVLHGERASLCGSAGDEPPAYLCLDRGQVERICREVLEQPDRHAALRALRDILLSLESELAGFATRASSRRTSCAPEHGGGPTGTTLAQRRGVPSPAAARTFCAPSASASSARTA